MTTSNDTPEVEYKQCTKCGEWKPATPEYFTRNRARTDGLSGECKQCTWDRLGITGENALYFPDAPDGYKYCRSCKELKPVSEFHKRPSNSDGLYSWCRSCTSEKSRKAAREKGVKPKEKVWDGNKRKCARCQEWLIFPDEYSAKSSPYCKKCNREYETEKRRKNGIYSRPVRRIDGEKQCQKCNQWFPATSDYFYKNKRLIDGLSYRCKNCDKIDAQLWRENNKNKKYLSDKRYRENNKEYLREKRRRYVKNNPHKIKKAALRKENRRRARKLNLPNSFSFQDHCRMTEYWNGCCAVCGRQLNTLFGDRFEALDHWVPLASPNCPGTIPENIVPLCHGIDGCNNKKSGKDPEVWLIETYGQRKAKQILDRIHTYFEWVKDQSD